MLGEDGTMPDRDAYCDKIRDTAEWGGNAEIVALSAVLKLPITVYAKSGITKFGEDHQGEPINLVYLKHAFGGIGEHYNAAMKI